jgi:Rrf2 family transcriptional regulator, nitric oxide-sensitive transcriptional repressor
MQLTRYTDYALRVLIYLAHKGELATIGEISAAYKISENHVMKIVHGLAKSGYITTLRGKGGGMTLARPAEKINLGEVVRNTEETLHVVECLADAYDGGCCLAPS